ncbi:hypothetical protein [Streptomyces sp. NPDC017868]|uniref:hypothetical protein n=1 Tax=Streptomyces sp. NPDC017868 TaxID=3365014 RepID=UPI0037B1EC76
MLGSFDRLVILRTSGGTWSGTARFPLDASSARRLMSRVEGDRMPTSGLQATSRGVVDLGSVFIAVAGVAGTLGGSLLTQRASERARRREIELVRDHEEVSESLALRRTCYVELNRDARQFTTAISRFLHVMQERRVEEADRAELDEAKRAHRDTYSQAQLIVPDDVLSCASAVNKALNRVYGQVKRLDREEPKPGETIAGAFSAQAEVWELLKVLRTLMRRDLGVASASDDAPARLPAQLTDPRS